MQEMWVGYNVGCTMGFLMGHSAWQIDQFPTCWPMNGLFVHWSMGWGVSSFSERLVMPRLDQSQSKKARGTRWLEIKSVNPWCDRPRFFHLRIGLRHLLHISRKSHMLHGMISIQVSHSIYDWIKALSCNEEQFWYMIENNTSQLTKCYILADVP